MKRFLWLGLGVICIVTLAIADNPGLKYPVEFTLAATSSGTASMSFTLAPRLSEAGVLAGPGGLGLIEDSTAPYRTAIGYCALYNNPVGADPEEKGYHNTAVGYQALFLNDTGRGNTATGYQALYSNRTHEFGPGEYNTASGCQALYSNYHGTYNVAIGASALQSNSSGGQNTAIGWRALVNNDHGNHNIAIGAQAGESIVNESCNIFIGNWVPGALGDNYTIRIGSAYGQTPAGGWIGQNRCFIAGIVESPFDANQEPMVVGITSAGQLGTMSSDLLPPGPQGPQGPVGPTGPPGPVGEGLISGSLLFLMPGVGAPTTGYEFIGTYELSIVTTGKKNEKLAISVYKKL